jgi:glycerol-3-phosphate acyltransferase PlsY
VPFSYLVARLAGIHDLRKVGSGNVGATNVMRSAGKLAGLAAFALDAGKGAIAVAIAQRNDHSGLLAALAAAGAVLGHIFPVWLGFRGGKGVATGAGAFLPVSPWASLGALVVFGLALLLTRFVSVGSIAGAVALVALLFLFHAPAPVAWAAAMLSAVSIARHAENIRRLANGTERRIGSRA